MLRYSYTCRFANACLLKTYTRDVQLNLKTKRLPCKSSSEVGLILFKNFLSPSNKNALITF